MQEILWDIPPLLFGRPLPMILLLSNISIDCLPSCLFSLGVETFPCDFS